MIHLKLYWKVKHGEGSPGPDLKIIGICYYANLLKEDKNKTQILGTQNNDETAYCPTNKTRVTS